MDILPEEIINEIIVVHKDKFTIYNISAVCWQWRRLALTTTHSICTNRELRRAYKNGDLLSVAQSSFRSINIHNILAYVCRSHNLDLIRLVLTKSNNLFEGFYAACRAGDEEAVQLLFDRALKRGIYEENNNLLQNVWQRIGNAIFQDSNEDGGLRRLLLTTETTEWNSALIQACRGGNLNLVKLLISKGAHYFDGGLCTACRGGHLTIVHLMLDNGADSYYSGFSNACRGGHWEIMQLMMDKGANNWTEGFYNACSGGHYRIVRLMMDKGVTNWNEGFLNACQGGHKEIVELMLAQGAIIKGGLYAACRGCHWNIIQLLIDKNAKDLNNLIIIACRDGRQDTIQSLIEKNSKEFDNEIINACRNGRWNIAHLMLEASNGQIMLDISSESREVSLRRLMTKYCVNVRELFLTACLRNYDYIIRALMHIREVNYSELTNIFSRGHSHRKSSPYNLSDDDLDMGIWIARSKGRNKIVQLIMHDRLLSLDDALANGAKIYKLCSE